MQHQSLRARAFRAQESFELQAAAEGPAGDEEKVAFGVARARALCSEPGDVLVVTAGISREAGSTNLIRVVTV